MLEYTASNAEMKKMYQRRRETLKKGTVFKHGGRQKENRCVEVLKNLLLGKWQALARIFPFRFIIYKVEKLHEHFINGKLC